MRMKMVLLLLILPSCLCAPTFVVNVTQSSYQAEEKHNITLEWTFSTKPHRSYHVLYIECKFIKNHRFSVFYQLYEGVEMFEVQGEQFAGRVQSDKDVLREGRIRLHVSRLRTEDSGLYLCDVKTDYGFGSEKCQLMVTAATLFRAQRSTLNPQAGSREKIGFYFFLGLTAAALLVVICFIRWFFTKSTHSGPDSHPNNKHVATTKTDQCWSDQDLLDVILPQTDPTETDPTETDPTETDPTETDPFPYHDPIRPSKAVSLYGDVTVVNRRVNKSESPNNNKVEANIKDSINLPKKIN
ncbi:uncharacterized protein LOC108251285 isoform X2 [Kryptolebias marmoratus]|uniref:uncharacterized protein LOC108251285 isoform X2 n=1 Tax=Kryptolebias marmoratus TaxID=37003 RepID=UPI000D52F300|nr:uncharacterized protein LOC108251285 isoform X2 [Kryptolebias marmoratus]